MNDTAPRNIRRFAQFLVFTLVTAFLLFVLLEGLSSTLLLVQDLLVDAARDHPEGTHTQYDAELGWVNVPNVYIHDRYGPRIYFRTNSQSFRNNNDFAIGEPRDKLRAICSGDSYALGYGVDNDHTWCELLTVFDDRFETVNMGQGGYGIDQAYLWYKRDGSKLEHSLHLFTFITDDFERMTTAEFEGYAKPILRLNHGTLVRDNVPVPQRAFRVPFLARNGRSIQQLRSVRLISRLLWKSVSGVGPRPELNDREAQALALKVFEELAELNETRNSTLVLVYLPIASDYSDGNSNGWRYFLSRELPKRGLIYLDLVESLRELPPSEVEKMYIPRDGHYTEEGNRYVSSWLYRNLLSIPEVSRRLAAMQCGPPTGRGRAASKVRGGFD